MSLFSKIPIQVYIDIIRDLFNFIPSHINRDAHLVHNLMQFNCALKRDERIYNPEICSKTTDSF